MCGIVGFFNEFRLREADLRAMVSAIRHRGPDGDGIRFDARSGVGLGNSRLAILDPGPAGAQPMTYGDSRCWITYNGELYNHVELREALQKRGCAFETRTDTEVILASYCMWGERCFERFNGMFALAIHDERKNILILCRDHFGIKPLYYRQDAGGVIFGSELKAFAAVGRKLRLNWNARALLTSLHVNYRLEATEHSYLADTWRLPPGHFVRVSTGKAEVIRWWHTATATHRVSPRFDEQVETFRDLFQDACRIRMRSDVPVGCALSGGLDSTSIVYTLRRAGYRPTPFMHAFPGRWYDETDQATFAARDSGLTPVEVHTEDEVCAGAIDEYTLSLETVSDSLLPRSGFRLCRAQRAAGVAVSIEGHGADEMLAGYPWQLGAAREDCFPLSRRFFDLLRLQSDMGGPRASARTELFRRVGLHKTCSPTTRPRFSDPSRHGGIYPESRPDCPDHWSRLQKMLYRSFHLFTLPTTLHFVDLNSMANGVEVRLPYLDPRLVAHVFSLPDRSKLDKGQTKYVLRAAMRGVVPDRIRLAKRKTPFMTPPATRDILVSALGEWVGDVLHADTPFDGLIDVSMMKSVFNRWRAGGQHTDSEVRSFCGHLGALRLTQLFGGSVSAS